MPPVASNPSVSRTLISLNTSSQMKPAVSTSTGSSATDQSIISAIPIASRLHDFQRSKQFGLAIVAVRPAAGRADRKHHRQAQRDGEVEVELGAQIDEAVRVPVG